MHKPVSPTFLTAADAKRMTRSPYPPSSTFEDISLRLAFDEIPLAELCGDYTRGFATYFNVIRDGGSHLEVHKGSPFVERTL